MNIMRSIDLHNLHVAGAVLFGATALIDSLWSGINKKRSASRVFADMLFDVSVCCCFTAWFANSPPSFWKTLAYGTIVSIGVIDYPINLPSSQ